LSGFRKNLGSYLPAAKSLPCKKWRLSGHEKKEFIINKKNSGAFLTGKKRKSALWKSVRKLFGITGTVVAGCKNNL
jgi:hypothetical protein